MDNPNQLILKNDPVKNVDIKISIHNLKKSTLIIRALNHKLRQKLIILLDEHKKMTVTDIFLNLRLEQSIASQHLAILRRAKIVTTYKEGKFVYYSINYNKLNDINNFIEQLVSG